MVPLPTPAADDLFGVLADLGTDFDLAAARQRRGQGLAEEFARGDPRA